VAYHIAQPCLCRKQSLALGVTKQQTGGNGGGTAYLASMTLRGGTRHGARGVFGEGMARNLNDRRALLLILLSGDSARFRSYAAEGVLRGMELLMDGGGVA